MPKIENEKNKKTVKAILMFKLILSFVVKRCIEEHLSQSSFECMQVK
jgi:hypothetical protein